MVPSELAEEVIFRDGPIPYFCRYADMMILTSTDTPIPTLPCRAASFLIADTDTAYTEKCADMPIFPIPILVLAHP